MRLVNIKKYFYSVCIFAALLLASALNAGAAELNGPAGQLLHSVFTHLIPGENYLLLVVKDAEAEDLLDEENLLYISQEKADGEGSVSFSYRLGSPGTAITILQGSTSDQMRELTWSMSEEGILTIYGQGDMDGFAMDNPAPWNSEKENIRTVHMDGSITAIGSYAFEGCVNLQEIYFWGGVPAFHENCFHSVHAIAYYPKDDPVWTDADLDHFGGNISWIPYEKRDQILAGTKQYTKTFGDQAFDLDTVLEEGDGVLSYSSSDPAVAEVSDSGRVTVKGSGSAEITVKASETIVYKQTTFAITVTVKKAAQAVEGTARYEKQLGAEPFTLETRCISGSGKLQYQSLKTGVAAVSDAGLVTVFGLGTAEIAVLAEETDNYLQQEYTVVIAVTAADGQQAAYEEAMAGFEGLLAQKSNYSEESWNAYEQAIKEADRLMKTEGITFGQLQEALDAIGEAKLVSRLAWAEEELNRIMEEMEQLSQEDYTEASWKQLQEALAEAKNLLEGGAATAEQLEDAQKKIEGIELVTKEEYARRTQEARDNLSVLIEEKQKELQQMQPSDYTAESWAVLQNAIREAQDLMGNAEATAEELQEAARKITEAVQGLKKAGGSQDSGTKPGTSDSQDPGTKPGTSDSQNPGSEQGTGTSPGNGSNSGNDAGQTVLIKKITMNPASYSIAAGRKVTLKPRISPGNASNQTLKWKTSNKKYATVKNGVVTAKKAGIGKKVTITAAAKDGSGIQKKVTIKIMKHAVKKIRLKAGTKSVKAGGKVAIQVSVQTTGRKVNKKLAWTSSNTRYASVSSKGVVKTKKAGKGKTVKITAKSTDGTNKSASVKIKIR